MAANDLARLIVKLEAQTAQYDASLKKATRELNKFRNDTKSALGKIERQFSDFGKNLVRTFGVASITAAVYGLTRAVGSAIKSGDELQKFTQKTGLTAEAASELAHAAKMADLDLRALETGLKKMQVTLSQAGSGTKTATETFAALGLSFDKLKQLQPDKQFELIAEQISRLKSPADKTRAAVELFGKAGADLLPLFEQGAEGIRKAREEAQRLGLSFSGENLKALADADDAIKRLKGSFAALGTQIALVASGPLTTFFDQLRIELGGGSLKENAIEELERQLAAFASSPNAAQFEKQIEQIKIRLQGLYEVGTRGPQSRGRGDAGKDPMGFGLTAEQLDKLQSVMVTAKKIITDYNQLLQDTETDVMAAARAHEVFRIKLNQLFEAGLITAEDYNNRLQEFLDKTIPEVEVTAKRIQVEKEMDKMSVYADQAARNMQDAFADFLFDPFEDGLRGMLKGFIDTLRRMVAEAAAAQIFDTLNIGGLLGGFFGIGGSKSAPIPSGAFGGPLAGGGPVTSGTPYLVGEKGPELFVPGASGNIVPNTHLGGITVNNNVDARGASMELAKALPGILQENNRRLVETLRDAKSRGSF